MKEVNVLTCRTAFDKLLHVKFYLMCSTRTSVLVADLFSHFVLGFCWEH